MVGSFIFGHGDTPSLLSSSTSSVIYTSMQIREEKVSLQRRSEGGPFKGHTKVHAKGRGEKAQVLYEWCLLLQSFTKKWLDKYEVAFKQVLKRYFLEKLLLAIFFKRPLNDQIAERHILGNFWISQGHLIVADDDEVSVEKNEMHTNQVHTF